MLSIYTTIASYASAMQHRMREDKGAAAVEYGLLVGLIAVAIIAAVLLLGNQLDALFDKITTALTAPSGVSAPAA
jgi:pilus assembly protein Flp/PilA